MHLGDHIRMSVYRKEDWISFLINSVHQMQQGTCPQKGGGGGREGKGEEKPQTFQLRQRLACFHPPPHLRCSDGQNEGPKGHLPPGGWEFHSRTFGQSPKGPIQEIKNGRLGINVSLVMMFKR